MIRNLLWLGGALFCVSFLHATDPNLTPVTHGTEKEDVFFQELDVPYNCPETFEAWNLKRESLRKSEGLGELFVLGKLLERCSKDPAQLVIFKNEKFQACMNKIQKLVGFALDGEETAKKEIQKINFHKNVNPKSRMLPASLQRPELYAAVKNRNEEEIKKQIAFIKAENPQSVTFRYLSPVGSLFYTVTYPENGLVRIIHFDENPDIIMLSKASVDKKGKKLSQPAFFMGRMHEVDPSQNEISQVNLVSGLKAEFETGNVNCFRCHQGSNVMPINSPEKESVESFDPDHPSDKVLAWFNETYVSASHNSAYAKLLSFMPRLGDNIPERNIKFVKQCAGVEDQESAQKVFNSMNCVRCHNGNKVDPIIFPFGTHGGAYTDPTTKFTTLSVLSPMPPQKDPADDKDVTKFVIDHMLYNGEMPPGAKEGGSEDYLSPEQRAALKECLLIEYFGTLYSGTRKKGLQTEGLLLKSLLEKPCPN